MHVLLVLRVCGLCAVLLMARQGTHLYVLNRDPGGRRHLCAGAHCMCVAGCSACSSILVCAWVVLVPCCSACYMQVVSVEVVSLRPAGCVVFTSVCMCPVGCCPACCCCACMSVWPVCGVADGSPGDAPVCAQPGLLDAGGVVSQVCIACGCQWCCAGVVSCSDCACALCGSFAGVAPSCRCWSWARRGGLREERRFPLLLGPWPCCAFAFCRAGCVRGLPCVRSVPCAFCRVWCSDWANGGAPPVQAGWVPARVMTID